MRNTIAAARDTARMIVLVAAMMRAILSAVRVFEHTSRGPALNVTLIGPGRTGPAALANDITSPA